MRYLPNKFRGFKPEKQRKTLLELARALEERWDDAEQRLELIDELSVHAGALTEPDPAISAAVSGLWRAVDLQSLMEVLTPLYRLLGFDPRDDGFLTHDRDTMQPRAESIPLTGVLHNLRSGFNTGSIFRIADCFGLERLILSGYTPTPDNPKLQQTAMGVTDWLPWTVSGDIFQTLEALRSRGCYLTALETHPRAVSLEQARFERPCVLIVGNEALGLEKKVLDSVDQIVSIPMRGRKNSLNVGVAFAVAVWEIARRWNLS